MLVGSRFTFATRIADIVEEIPQCDRAVEIGLI